MHAAHPFMANTLAELGVVSRARAVVLWSYTDERLDLVCDWRLNQSLFNMMHLHWPDVAVELREGRRVTLDDQDVVLIPLMGHGYRLVGVLQHAGPLPEAGARHKLVDEIAEVLTEALQDGPPPVEPEAFTVPLPHVERRGGIEDVERHIYSRLLLRHGWNVTLLAKVLGIARQTLQNRLAALQIGRPGESPKARPRKI